VEAEEEDEQTDRQEVRNLEGVLEEGKRKPANLESQMKASFVSSNGDFDSF
jgi:hypothetical protein